MTSIAAAHKRIATWLNSATKHAETFYNRRAAARPSALGVKSAAVDRLAWRAFFAHTFSPALAAGLFSCRFQEQKGRRFIEVEIRGAPNRGPRAPAPTVPMGAGLFFAVRRLATHSDRAGCPRHRRQAGRVLFCQDVYALTKDFYSRATSHRCKRVMFMSKGATPRPPLWRELMALNRQMLFQQRDRQAIFLRETEPRAARPERPLLREQ